MKDLIFSFIIFIIVYLFYIVFVYCRKNVLKKFVNSKEIRAEKAEEKPAVKEADEASPSEAETARPAQSSSQPAASGDVPLSCWSEVISALEKTDIPLMGILTGSSAFIRGEHLLIKCDNPTFPQFIKVSLHAAALREAVTKVTGQKYRLGIYRSEATGAGAVKKDPLAELVKKINN